MTRWELYRVLSEPVRLRLLALAAEEELAIGELAELLGDAQPKVSRHVQPMKRAGLLDIRRQGTRSIVRLADRPDADPVVADALRVGRALCEEDGSLSRIADVLRAREASSQVFFAERAETPAVDEVPSEFHAYLGALSPLLSHNRLAVDVGVGSGGLLDVLAPMYRQVVAIDREPAQLEVAAARLHLRGYDNVSLLRADLGDPSLEKKVAALADGALADAVFAARLLHHAPRPAQAVSDMARLLRPGGALVVVDYEAHQDEAMRERQADVWLGFARDELRRFAHNAGLTQVDIRSVGSARRGNGPDAHLAWQVMVARRPELAS